MDHTEAKVREFRAEVLDLYLLIAAAVSLVSVPVYLFIDVRPLTIACTVYFAVVSGIYLVRRATRIDSRYCVWSFLTVTLLMLQAGLFFGNEFIDDNPWHLLFPIVAFIVAGSRAGVGWSVVGLTVALTDGALRGPEYRPISLFILVVAYFAAGCAMYVFTRRNEQNIRTISRLSHTDPLTKTYNRHLFKELSTNVVNRARRAREPLAVYMIDIDFFKLYNDQYGHLAGDRALTCVADVLRQTARRASDLVFRYGGEEFCILSSGISADDARTLGENIIEGVRRLDIDHARVDRGMLTVSVGFSYDELLVSAQSVETLLKCADIALYDAKTRGRDRLEKYVAARPEAPGLAAVS